MLEFYCNYTKCHLVSSVRILDFKCSVTPDILNQIDLLTDLLLQNFNFCGHYIIYCFRDFILT